MNKVIDFKTASPLFEQEKDGFGKPFTIRHRDPKDKRFKALSQWRPDLEWYIRITNPNTGEQFTRVIRNYSYLWWFDASGIREPRLYPQGDWVVIEWFPLSGLAQCAADKKKGEG